MTTTNDPGNVPFSAPEQNQRAITLLNHVHVASPCNESWDAMPGGEQVRSCARCQHKVYNMSEMTALEAAALIEKAEGRLCVRFYRRMDGTVMTKDCPVGARLKRRRLARAGGVGLTAFAVACGAGLASKPRSEQPPFLRWLMNRVSPESEAQAVAGGLSFRPLPMASPTTKPLPTSHPEMGAPRVTLGRVVPRAMELGEIIAAPQKTAPKKSHN